MVDLYMVLKNGKEYKIPCEKQEALDIYNGTKHVMENGISASIEVELYGRKILIDASCIAVLEFHPEEFKNSDEE